MLNWCWPHGLWVLAARALEENARMSAPGTIERPSVQVGGDSARPASALSRYFEISLFLMLLVSVLALVSTGKLDLVTIVLAPAALLVKGYRWWHGRGPEISHRTATFLVVIYFVYFQVDLWWISPMLSSDAQTPALFSKLL